MKALLLFTLFAIGVVLLFTCQDARKDPYEEGMHWDYSIRCDSGFLWKTLDNRQGTIPVLHSDGTHMRCGEKRH